MKFFIILFAVLSLSFGSDQQCPDKDILPCTCKTYFDGACIITCSFAAQKAMEKLGEMDNLCNGHVHFVLAQSRIISGISGIPTKLWKTLLSSKTVDISIKYATIGGLAPPGVEGIPEAHTPGPAVIKVNHATVGRWDWKLFHKFQSGRLENLVIIKNSR